MRAQENITIRRYILIIDDNKDLCEVICDTLDAYGHSAAYVCDTNKITNEVLSFADIIFLDLCIPENDGVDMIKILAKQNSHADLVLMSGSGNQMLSCAENLAHQYGLNVVGTIAKPFRAEELVKFVNRK